MLLKALKCEAQNLQIKLIWFWFISQFNSHPIWNTHCKKDDFNPLHPNTLTSSSPYCSLNISNSTYQENLSTNQELLEFVIINSLFFWPKFVIQGWYCWKK